MWVTGVERREVQMAKKLWRKKLRTIVDFTWKKSRKMAKNCPETFFHPQFGKKNEYRETFFNFFPVFLPKGIFWQKFWRKKPI